MSEIKLKHYFNTY